ncbi:hypothetical protein Terro_4268 [Terriglobus roseus DSM 18391]|uniref:Uncharacterized protein n=1 Tax=Terriglobus roseus (strain DSM 18391 / NRRL B-41598 / KBS 63) TaxID=926566 RepID=I3ZMK3_TERRK|nr:hypothetical protein [Terriglobus roseus]AFL90471.1 hypothetical protein Terro_4268 [Terriglobus roseus DSM 18391]
MVEKGLRYSAATAVFYALFAFALWSVYSMRAQVEGGGYSLTEAHSLVLKMAAITTGLCAAATLLGRLIFRSVSRLGTAVRSGWCTGLCLVAYTAANVLWRNSWDPTSVKPAFFPFWGDVNARFFYEYNWLSYLLFLTPLAMITAAALMWLAERRKT